MNPLPLIPRSNDKSNHDTSHVIREAFQEFLGRQTYPKNITENMCRNNPKMEEMKMTGITANSIFHKAKVVSDGIAKVEIDLMERKGEYLTAKHLITADRILNETIKLKHVELFRKLTEGTANKYNMLECHGLLPTSLERSIDFRLNSNTHLCMAPCKSDLDVVPTKLTTTQFKCPVSPKTDTVFGETGHLNERAFVPKTGTVFGETGHLNERAFVANPARVVFYNYDLNVTYKRTLKIRNVTNKNQMITLKILPKSKFFTITQESGTKIAPGMCAVYSVKYKTHIYHDIHEIIVFTSYTGCDVKVALITQRDSPSLRTYIFKSNDVVAKATNINYLSGNSFDIDRAMALNSTIDCGYTLIGDEVKLSLIMKNEGGYGKFFMVAEEDWFCVDVKNLNSKMELNVGSFRFYPAYFEVNENEFVEVDMYFYPKKYGLFVETLYLLCSNNTFEQLDVIGDGVHFNKDFVTFDLIKKESRPFFLDFESEYCLHVGRCLTGMKITGTISVLNNSSLNLSFRWNIRKSVNSKSTDMKNMIPHWIRMMKVPYLPSNSTTDFEITIFPETSESGLHHTVISLYIENIPETSLQDHENFSVIERKDYFLDIFIGEVEILCEVEEAKVVIEPNPLVIPYELTCFEEHRQIISILPRTNFPMNCKWIIPTSSNTITINPQEFEVQKNTVNCVVMIFPTEIKDVDEELLLNVNGGMLKEYLRIKARVIRPTVAFSLAKLDFGNAMKYFSYTKIFHVQNHSHQYLKWYVEEEVFDFATKQFVRIENPVRLTPTGGDLHGTQSCQVEYTANTQVSGEGLSYLKLYTDLSTNKESDFVCVVHCNTCIPEIQVHSDTSELPMICPTDLLYADVVANYKLCLHNSGHIHIMYLFGKPTGASSEEFDIRIVPEYGLINMHQNVHVNVQITPHRMGFFEDVYLPLFILGKDDIILIQVMCVVGDVTVNIHIPNRLGNYVPVLWPRLFREVCYEDIATEYLPDYKHIIDENENMENITEPSIIPDVSSYEDQEEKLSEVTQDENRTEVTTLYVAESIRSSESGSNMESNSDQTTTNTTNISSSIESSNFTEETFPSRQKLKQLFGKDLILHEYILEYPAVPLKTPVKRTIKIENLTPGRGKVAVEVTNFFHTERKQNVLNDLLVKMKMIKSSEWEHMVGSDGIVVKIDKPSNQLNSYDIIEFDVWVFANTWGFYIDEIVIDVSQLMPFCASLVIEVVGLPIEFPIAQNSLCKEPTLRLGVLPFASENIQRKLKVCNRSVIPICVTWYFFLNSNPDEVDKAFSVIFDVVNSESESSSIEGRLLLTREYYGEFTSIFEASPNILRMEPESTMYVDILTNVCRFDDTFLNKNLAANLIGIIDLREEYRFQPNLFKRPSGVDMEVARMKLTCELQVPMLDIDNIPDSIEISIYANDIMDKFTFEHKKRLLFKNSRHVPAIIYMEIMQPFEIISVKTCNITTDKFNGAVLVNPSQCIEIIIQCTMYKDEIIKILQVAKNKFMKLEYTNPKDNSFLITKSLAIFEIGKLQKLVPFDLTIYYPLFKAIPNIVEFGTVFVGNTSKSIVTLKNFTAACIPFEVLKPNKLKEVVIQPSSGVIPKVTQGGDIILSIFFTPSESRTYQECIVITSNIPRHHVAVRLIGVGTYSEGFYVPGMH